MAQWKSLRLTTQGLWVQIPHKEWKFSGAEFASEVGDRGGGAVLCAVGVGKENMNSKILFASYDETFFHYYLEIG